MRSSPGITLTELLVILAAVAVVLSVALPSFHALLLESRMTAAVNALVRAVHLARVVAQQRTRDVVICRSEDGSHCAAGNWASGWMVFVNTDGDEPPVMDPGERMLHIMQPMLISHISSNRTAYVLRPMGRRATNGTITFCDTRGAPAARAVVVSYTGRPRVTQHNAKGGALKCPAPQ